MVTAESELESREAQILRWAASGARERFEALLETEVDSTHLFDMARTHGLLATLHRQLEAGATGSVPKGFVAFLGACAQAQGRANLSQGQALCQVTAGLHAGGMPAIAFGGAVLAFTAYQDRALRQFEELKLLVYRRDLQKAKLLLEPLGFGPPDPAGKQARRPANHIALRRESDDTRLEIHWNIAPPGFPARLDYSFFREASRTIQVLGREVRALSPEDELLAACVDGVARYWLRLQLICDVAQLLRANPSLGWEPLLARAGRVGCRRGVLLGLVLAKTLLGSELPNIPARRIEREPRVRELASYCERRLLSNVGSAPQGPEKLVFQWKAREHWRGRLLCGTRWLRWHARQLKHPWLLARTIATGFAPPEAAIFVPTREEVAARMLELAGVGPDDLVYDLGCGDGRILILAARRFGARGVGFELNPQRVAAARKNARQAGVEHLLEFRQEDFAEADFSAASVMTLYLYGAANVRLRPKLLRELRPGARIVSHDFNMGDWAPSRTEEVPHLEGGGKSRVYLWVCPPSGE